MGLNLIPYGHIFFRLNLLEITLGKCEQYSVIL